MPITSSRALLAALALVAVPAFAQDSAPSAEAEAPAAEATDAATTEAPSAEATATEAEAQAAETAPAAGEPATAAEAPASDEPQVGSYYIKSTQKDWTLRCIKAGEGKDPCELYQLMKDANGNSVAEMTLIPLNSGQVAAGATLIAPLETDLVEGLSLAIDSGKASGYPFSFCAPIGCISRMGFTAAEIGALKNGGKVTVSLLPFGADPKDPVKLTLSLAGFTAAYDELTAYAAAAAPAAAEAPAGE
ncbi:invasion associated locus B family protein [Paracoccus marinaquae]|uniref:Invasion associated locus B family protein n=1 Tax=Paracoccus marinaquae TaxID=2841926 RepID=A0ABS6AI10_9RHOB|nr:invasion associated locus B family protein [Paracoccus marinaquae]MBU3030238.1 invasion associated locus B family protein [Paracoccus marinaquae]